MSTFSLVAPLALIAAAGAAAAQPRPAAPAAAQPRPAAPAAAASGPEPLDRAEFIKEMDRNFAARDADRDGGITAAEVTQFQRASALAAARERNAVMFRDLDKDRNGTLTAAEFGNLPMQLPEPNPGLVMAFDGNRDRKVTLIEYRTGALVNFDRMDTDKDGIVSVAELRAANIR